MTNSLLAEFSHGERKMKRRRKEKDKVSLLPLIFLSPWENSAKRENEQPKRLKKNLDEIAGNRRSASSVGKAPVFPAGGRWFEARADQQSGFLNNWEESAAF